MRRRQTPPKANRIAVANAQCLGATFLAASMFVGCHKPTNEDKKETQKVQVRVEKAEQRTLRPKFEIIGVVQASPERQALLSAGAPGLVETLAVREGASVHKGDVILKLDERKARIDLDRAEAALARLIAKPRKEELSQTTGALEKAKAAHEMADRRLKKSQELRRQNPELVPEIQLLDDRRAEEAARTDLESATSQLELLNKGPREELRREAQVEVDSARLQLDLCRVVAPFDGDLVEILARTGMKADLGAPVARLIDISEVVVQTRIPGDRLMAVASSLKQGAGLPAEVTCEAFPGEQFKIISGWLSQQTESVSSDVAAKFRVENSKRLLRVGMSVEVEINEPPVDGVAVPEAAVSVNEEGHKVVTVVSDGKAVPTEIETASEKEREVRSDGWIRVLKGVKAGDEVAVENGYALPKDTPVEIMPAAKAESGEHK